jgi:6-pyruvoyltetrahydropterin/6-carboxytetrahydropterin synthase
VHRLVRKVRFSVNPFGDAESEAHRTPDGGANSYCGKPCGEGLSLFFELSVGLAGQSDKDTGFVVNVIDIDRVVRECAVPVFAENIRRAFGDGKQLTISETADVLASLREVLKGKFNGAMLIELGLGLNPYRKIEFDCEDVKMYYFSEKFDFAAMHKLWNEQFSERKNFEVFGKCANPAGHGHNYVIEVTIKTAADTDIRIGDFERIVDGEFVRLVDHKNLNADVAALAGVNPTIENLAQFAWGRLNGRFDSAKLHSVSIWESDRTCCTYYG